MIALIAGTGSLPLEACKALRAQQKDFFVVSLFPEDNLSELQQATESKADIICQPCYKAGAIINLLKERKTEKILMIGKVDKRTLLKKISLDWFAIKILASLLYKNDASIMQRIVDELSHQGMDVIQQDDVLGALLVEPGILTGTLTPELETNIELGMQTAKHLSLCDIGQTVVVKDKMVLAVEAIEGTDECIKRGVALGTSNVVVCKAAHPNQNKRFDLPTLGPTSLAWLKKGDVKAIAWLSTHTFIAQQQQFIQKARELGITLISVADKLPINCR
ncbi:UDP-2,3-diacylglucosamine diphosphatase LpxI [Candidatus Babeliales bacterium]|nr:UDP-2,3-diacylglucosamine diphosphatase LpxI [Candidatus Babeliales bacterium]